MRHARASLLEVHAAVLLFGLAGLFGKLLALPPTLIVFGRTAFAAAFLALVLLVRRPGSRPRAGGPVARRGRPGLVLAGLVLALHWVTFFRAIQASTVAVGLLTFSTFPLFVTFLEPIAFRERPRGRDAGIAALMVAGLALVVPRFDWGDHTTRGACWGTLSGLCFAVLSLLNRRLVRDVAPLVMGAWQNAVAALALTPPALAPWVAAALRPGGAAGTPVIGPAVGGREVLLLAVLGVFCTAIAHVLFIAGLAGVRAQVASVVTGLEAVYGVLFALAFLGEVPPPRTLAGGALILAAVALATALRDGGRALPPDPAPGAGRDIVG